MNLLDLPWEIILIILKQYNDYKYCIRLLVTCKQLYGNKLLVKEIKDYFTKYKVDQYGIQHWYFNGKLHRDNDKPAIVGSDRYKVWYLNGKCHREYGPARIWPNESKEWWLYGKYYTEEKYWIEMKKINSLKN